MPNLNRWIEAQLKRGHSREAIKKQLLKRGYSRKAVAEVDRIAGLNKKLPSLPSVHIFVLVLVLIAVIGVWVLNSSPGQKKESAESEVGEGADKTEFVTFNTSTGAYSIPKDVLAHMQMCEPFRDFNDSIPCFNAIQRSLGVFNGAVISVNRTVIVFPTNTSIPPWSAWLIKMRLNDPIPLPDGKLAYEGEVVVHTVAGEVRPYRLIA